MTEYDFGVLNDKEFESLCIDLLSQKYNTSIERFKSGKDGGVDGRFFITSNQEVVIQCKHWVKSGVQALIREVKSSEADKVTKINPAQYIFVTSLNLSRSNKSKISRLFDPYIHSESDVLGNEDINDLLSSNGKIELKYYKLWISSTNVLRSVLNSAIVGRSENTLQEIFQESNRYVTTLWHDQAIEKLNDIHSVIITGMPGIGKTTLAGQLCASYVAKGYEFFFIEGDLSEAENIYDQEKKQVFYFDDFLGRNFLLALSRHQDSKIINFIKRVEKDNNKRFILTSRTNILNQGKRLNEMFNIKKTDKNEYEISINALNAMDKAKILYNHIWFSSLSESYISEIYKERRYLEIIKHKNFNPRLIEFITDSNRLSEIDRNDYWEHIEKTLNNPKDIWKSLFDVQISKEEREIIIAVTLHGKRITEEELKKFYINLSNENQQTNKTFDAAIRLLSGALLNRYFDRNRDVTYNLFDPSIADYIISDYLDNPLYISKTLQHLQTANSIENIRSLYFSDTIDRPFIEDILQDQLQKLFAKKPDINDYILAIFSLTQRLITPSNDLKKNIQGYAEKALTIKVGHLNNYKYCFEFIRWLININVVSTDSPLLMQQLNNWINYKKYHYDELLSLSEIIYKIEDISDDLTFKIQDMIIDEISFNINDWVMQDSTIIGAAPHESPEMIVEYISDFIGEILDESPCGFDHNHLDHICNHCNFDIIIDSVRERHENANRAFNQTPKDNYYQDTNNIDDLFQRT